MSLLGYLVASSVFHNRQIEDGYWFSREGRLLGVIPCPGSDPCSFCTKFLEHKSSSDDDKDLSSLMMAMEGLVVLNYYHSNPL